MKDEKRINEITSQITAFTKDSYSKSEFLPELFKLQQEIVDLTFNSDHAENGNLRLWNVETHFQEMNEERGYIADAELEKFIRSSEEVCNTIKAEISGNKGEKIVFRTLGNLQCENGVLRNVELEFEGRRTEIDAIVFTNRAVFIIEVKNSSKDIFIDENGDFYRIGNSMHFDCNIADKMNEREDLLRKALERSGVENPKIFKIVTFTNNHIDVENKYHYIKVCGSNYLPVFIEKFKSDSWYNYENICTMMAAVTETRCKEAYQMSIDMNEYKYDFANLMVTLESAEDMQYADDKYEIKNDTMLDTDIFNPDAETEKDKHTTYFVGNGVVVAAVCFTLLNVAILSINKLIRK